MSLLPDHPDSTLPPWDTTRSGFVMPPLVWGQANLAATAGTPRPWLWQGYLAPGALTVLTGQWKAGKTTLLSILLARLKTGGVLAGQPLTAGQAVVVSEESAEHWQRRGRQFDFGDHVGWYCQPFLGRPLPDEWRSFIEGIAELRSRRDFALVAIDTLSAFFPSRSESNAGCMLDALAPLRQLTRRSLSVCVMHHPGKGDPPLGQLARGSGALAAAADIVLEMRPYPRAAEDDRRRWLQALSRYAETPRQSVIELTADGTDYICRGTFHDEEFSAHWAMLRPLLAAADTKMSRQEIEQCWPGGERPDRGTLGRWLARAVLLGLVRRDGLGRKKDPFRYWLPEREEAWRKDPLAMLRMPEFFQPAASSRPGRGAGR